MDIRMIVIGNGKLITRNDENQYIENGAVAVDGERIIKVGNDAEVKKEYPKAEYIDAQGMIIMPGLINAHQHIYSAYARGLIMPGEPAMNFLEILDKTWWHIDNRLTLDNTYYSALVTYIECIKNGVTCVVDHHAGFGSVEGSLFKIGQAADELGIRTCLAYEISDRNGKDKCDASIKENMEWIEHTKKLYSDDNTRSRMLSGLVGMHAAFTLSDETLAKCREANTSNAGYHIHISEGEYDEQYTKEKYNMSVVERLYKHGILGNNTLAGHCIHISDSDMDIIKDTGTKVVHNPESNMSNAVGAPQIIKMYDKGIMLGLGTDGYTNDMLESLKVANILQKHNRKLPDRGMSESCEMLFKNNATIAGSIFNDSIGVLCEGALADIIIVDYKPYTRLDKNNINGHVMFGMQGAMTDTTMINGKLLMRHRKLLNIDEEEILNKSIESANELWRCM